MARFRTFLDSVAESAGRATAELATFAAVQDQVLAGTRAITREMVNAARSAPPPALFGADGRRLDVVNVGPIGTPAPSTGGPVLGPIGRGGGGGGSGRGFGPVVIPLPPGVEPSRPAPLGFVYQRLSSSSSGGGATGGSGHTIQRVVIPEPKASSGGGVLETKVLEKTVRVLERLEKVLSRPPVSDGGLSVRSQRL